ncbi:MAG: GTPase Era [Oscillospiraceae bacterium]
MEKTVCAALVGQPNVGKSTLLNALVGAKIAITSPKPQTTRNRILGVVTKDETQYIYIDTPGFHAPKSKLGEHMVKAVRDSAADVDCALFLTWGKNEFDDTERGLLEELAKSKIPTILVINKSDTFKSPDAGEKFLQSLQANHSFAGGVCTSALTRDGLSGLVTKIDRFALEGPHLYDDDTLTDVPERVIASELVRESLLYNLSEELPHGCAVSVESFRERADRPLIDIEAEIICEKNSHKGMIIGKGGFMLKKIGTQAREQIEEFLDCKVNLKLWVKVREGWRDKEQYIKSLGL